MIALALLTLALGLDSPPLIDAAGVVPGLQLDLRYAGPHNLVGRPISPETRCRLRPQATEALAKAEALVARQGFRLLAWDCYRPPSVQWVLWQKQPTPGLVANPKRGSNHSRGAAIDLTLVRADGSALEMPTDFDDLSPRAARDATAGISVAARTNRAILRRAMLSAGFTSIRREWWHFDLVGALKLPVLPDVPANR